MTNNTANVMILKAVDLINRLSLVESDGLNIGQVGSGFDTIT